MSSRANSARIKGDTDSIRESASPANGTVAGHQSGSASGGAGATAATAPGQAGTGTDIAWMGGEAIRGSIAPTEVTRQWSGWTAAVGACVGNSAEGPIA